MSLKDVLLEELKTNHVKVKVVHKQADKFIVADSSMLAIFLATNILYEKLRRKILHVPQAIKARRNSIHVK